MRRYNNKKPTVTVAISAYNEERNIGAFLESVLQQKEDSFKLKYIWVFNDGSTDCTREVVLSLKSNKVKYFDDKLRIGKSSRLNVIYKKLQTDILVQSDADIVMSHPLVIHDLIQPLIEDSSVGMCGGEPRPLPGTTFTEKAVNCTVEAYLPFRKNLRGGNNIFSVDGRLLAYRKELVKRIHIPETMTSNDKFTYYSCLMNGYKYRHIPTSVVLYRSPKTLKDQIRQNGRFLCSPVRHSRYFPPEVVKNETYIPLNLLVRNSLKQFIHHPLMCTYIFVINTYCRLNVKKLEVEISAKWPMAVSTKNLRTL
jgi:cellulose synthase/poly-beta-1,6-N-acetylglucosamine synthase-like glycosyltransferase